VDTLAGVEIYRFLLDTGADFSAAPRSLAEQVGLHWNELPAARVAGVGSSVLDVRVGGLPIRLGDTSLTVRCFFIDEPRAPFVLGRADVLERFVTTFDAGNQRITLTAIE